MILEKHQDIAAVNLPHGADLLIRPRVNAILKEACDYPLVIICAGSGYGKTQAVSSFLDKFDAHSYWQQISVPDNNITRFWESYAGMVSLTSPEASAQLKELGFPRTGEALRKFDAIRRETAEHPGKLVKVFDDFHLLRNRTILRFFEHLAGTSPLNMTVIIITRATPDINLIGMIMRGNVYTIQEETLCFTEDELSGYFRQLNLSTSAADIRNIHDDTKGWAFAVNMIGHSLIKKKKYERYALEAMKKNIFRLIEAEICESVSGPLLHFLARVSLIDHHAAGLITALAGDNKDPQGGALPGEALVREMEKLNTYIRYDYSMDKYMIHHLFLDYLRQQKNQILTDEEKKRTYEAAALWCDSNGYYADTLSYYEKSGNYEAITRKLVSLSVQLPHDMAQYAMEILERMPDDEKSRVPLFPCTYIRLKINLGQLEEAEVFAKKYAADYEARPETQERNRALTAIYAAWGLLRMHMCTYNDVYDFDVHFRKMDEYFEKSPFMATGACKVTSLISRAAPVGTNRPGALEEYLGAISRSGPWLSRALYGFNDGFEDLARGELCLNRMDLINAEQYLKQSIAKARESDQYVTQNRALVYLMYIDIQHGDIVSATAKLREMEALLGEKDYGVRYTMYDIARGFYYLALEQSEQIPEWLKDGFASFTHPSFLENYANRARALYCYQTRKYKALLEFIENALKFPSILYDRVEFLVLRALSLFKLKTRGEAIAAFTEAYHLAESNKLTALFVKYEKDMRALSFAAAHHEKCQIPGEWLADIHHKSSVLAKRRAKIISEYRQASNPGSDVRLTDRENAILRDLSGGQSRAEIAAARNIPPEKVKRAVAGIYQKLCVTSLPEAIRAAVDLRII